MSEDEAAAESVALSFAEASDLAVLGLRVASAAEEDEEAADATRSDRSELIELPDTERELDGEEASRWRVGDAYTKGLASTERSLDDDEGSATSCERLRWCEGPAVVDETGMVTVAIVRVSAAKTALMRCQS